MCNTWINVKGNDNGIISNNNTLTHQRTTKTHKNFLADRWAFDDVAVSTSRAKQRLATSGTTWLIVELRRLDLSLEILFRSFFLSCYIDRRVNDGLLFKFSKEFEWNWMRHAEKVNDLLFFCSRFFFYQFFVSTSLWLWCVHSCAILMGKNHRITCETSVLKIARLFLFCSGALFTGFQCDLICMKY